jgi:hypothetical protein
MEPADFAAWLEHVQARHGWTKAEAMRRLGADKNQSARWTREGATIPLYIALACAGLARRTPIAPWSGDVEPRTERQP